MNKSLVFFLVVFSSLLIFQDAKADTIAAWTFETSQPNAVVGGNIWITNIFPEIGNGTASGLHHFNSTTYSSPVGNGSNHSFTANSWTNNPADFFQFAISTTNSSGFYTNLTLSFDEVRSANGPTNWTFQYSTNGSTFFAFLSYSITNTPSFSSGSSNSLFTTFVDLSSIPVLANSPSVYFRLIDASRAINAAGTVSVDNFDVSGTLVVVPEPSVSAIFLLSCGACLLAVRRKC